MKPRIRIKQMWYHGVELYLAYDSNPHVSHYSELYWTPEQSYERFVQLYGEY